MDSGHEVSTRCPMCGADCAPGIAACGECGEPLQKSLAATNPNFDELMAYAAVGIPVFVVVLSVLVSLLRHPK